jgi:pimeloyl-ACP methyl ester carboxylesterase
MHQLRSTATHVGELQVPDLPLGVVVVADGDAHAQLMTEELHDAYFATLQLDPEAIILGLNHSRASMRALVDQVLSAADWIGGRPDLADLPVGVFGYDAGGSAALAAATERPHAFRAVVSRDGQPFLAGSTLVGVRAATLLIVDAQDEASIAFSQDAMTRVEGIAELEILAAGETLDSARTRAQVARLARRWFARFLP